MNRASGILIGSGAVVEGYEIHMGKTRGKALERPAMEINGEGEGVVSADNQILCTYLHGLFDTPQACDALLQWAGLEDAGTGNYAELRQREFDRVAAMLEEEVGIEVLANCAGLETG